MVRFEICPACMGTGHTENEWREVDTCQSCGGFGDVLASNIPPHLIDDIDQAIDKFFDKVKGL